MSTTCETVCCIIKECGIIVESIPLQGYMIEMPYHSKVYAMHVYKKMFFKNVFAGLVYMLLTTTLPETDFDL